MKKEKNDPSAEHNLSSFLRRKPYEVSGSPIKPELRSLLNGVIQQYSQLCPQFQVFREGEVQVVRDRLFDHFIKSQYESSVHPLVRDTLDDVQQRLGLTQSFTDAYVKNTDLLTPGFGRSAKIFIRQSATFSHSHPKGSSIVRRELEADEQIRRLGLTLLKNNFNRSARVRVTPIDNAYKKRFVEQIARTDALRFHHFGNNAVESYACGILDYLKDKEVRVLCTGVRTVLETEGYIICTSQLDFDNEVTNYLISPMVVDFVKKYRERNANASTRRTIVGSSMAEIVRHNFQIASSSLGIQIPKKVVKERLTALGGLTYHEQLAFYLSGKYFENHLQVLPNHHFLP